MPPPNRIECFAIAAYKLVNDSTTQQQLQDHLDDEKIEIIEDWTPLFEDLPNEETPSEEELVSFCWVWAEEIGLALRRRYQRPSNPSVSKRDRDDWDESDEDEIVVLEPDEVIIVEPFKSRRQSSKLPVSSIRSWAQSFYLSDLAYSIFGTER